MAKTNKPGQQQRWAEAQRRCRLSDEAVRMAKELGLNPRSLIKDIPSPKQQWEGTGRGLGARDLPAAL